MKRAGKRVGKQAGKQVGKRAIVNREGEPAQVVVSLKSLTAQAEVLMKHVEELSRIAHSACPAKEKADLASLSKALEAAHGTLLSWDCPNPMFTLFTVDRSQVRYLDKG